MLIQYTHLHTEHALWERTVRDV